MEAESPSLPPTPLTSEEFDQCMENLAPFEPHPVLAVAVSGGIDSFCLTLLLQKWAQERQGRLMALTVDHGLRPESSIEASQVGVWLSRHGIEHHILQWTGPKPSARIQENARRARYQLLEGWCKDRNILHLCLGHQKEDQEETFLFRLCSGSGLDGLAAMAAIAEKPNLRILRPLLNVRRERLQQTLLSIGQEWIEDPCNLNMQYTRTRLRQIQKALAFEGLTPERISKITQKMAMSRAALEHQATAILAKTLQIFPSGYAVLDVKQLLEVPEDMVLRVLSASLACISGKSYPPRRAHLESLKNEIIPDTTTKGRTCWGCSIIPWRGRLLILRETAAISQQIMISQIKNTVKWDDRFTFVFNRRLSSLVTLGKLGTQGWVRISGHRHDLRRTLVPPRVRPTLPALWQGDEVISVPHLNYYGAPHILSSEDVKQIIFSPSRALCSHVFTVS